MRALSFSSSTILCFESIKSLNALLASVLSSSNTHTFRTFDLNSLFPESLFETTMEMERNITIQIITVGRFFLRTFINALKTCIFAPPCEYKADYSQKN